MTAASVADRLAAGAAADENGCLTWKRCVNSRGYGQIGVNGKVLLTHRVARELVNGPIPDEMTIDHLCRNKRCIAIDHLEVVTRAENISRAAVLVTHCKKAGHPLEGHNVIVKVRKDGGLSRSCRECQYAARRTGRPRGRPGHRDYVARSA